jgi:hypothetical protein
MTEELGAGRHFVQWEPVGVERIDRCAGTSTS